MRASLRRQWWWCRPRVWEPMSISAVTSDVGEIGSGLVTLIDHWISALKQTS
jgi:hypothetical protein